MISLLLLTLVLPNPTAREPLAFSRQVYLMGTQATLSARNASRADALADLDVLLASLEESEDALSTWRDTPFNRLNTLPEDRLTTLSPWLCRLVTDLYIWTARTGGAFDPGVGPLLDTWRVQSHARVASPGEVREVLAASRLSSWRFDAGACALARPHGGRLDSGAFGKGEALDRAASAGRRGSAWLIDLGGQVSVGGAPAAFPWRVGIAHPLHRDQVLFEVELQMGSVATSGGSERDQHVGKVRVGHILDPRTGKPASFSGSVVVWHQRALVADILSTALYVMGTEAGLRWAERNEIAACFLVPDRSRVRIRPTGAFTRHFGVRGAPR